MLNKVNASVKLYMLILITAASLIGMGLYGVNDLKEMDDNTHSLYADRVLPIQQLSTLRFEYAAEVVPMAQRVKNRELSFNQAKERIEKAQAIINTNWDNYKLTYLTPEEASLVKETDEIKKQADETYKNLQTIFDREDPSALNAFIQKEHPVSPDLFFVKLTGLMNLQVKVGKQLLASNNEIYHTTAKRFFLIILISLAIALSLSFYLTRSIKNLIKNILKSNDTIKESEEKYHSLFEQASDAIYVLNFKGDFTQVNNSMCQMVGYTRDELLVMNVTDLITADILNRHPLIYSQLKSGQSATGERKLVKKDGAIFDIEINVKKFTDDRILAIVRDITARKAMETELKNAELKFRTLADKSMVGIYIVQKGKFVYVNPRFAEVFGYNAEDLIGQTPVEAIIHLDYRVIADENVRKRVEGETESVHYEAMGKRQDGSANWVEFYGSRAIFEGEPTIIGSMIDITERKMAEEELKSSEQKYKLLFESSPVPLWMIARDDLSIIAVNETAARLYGYKKEEILNKSAAIVRLPDDLEKQKQGFLEDISRPTDRGVIRHVKKDGTVFYVNVILNEIMFDGRIVRLVLTTDVTEKLKSEESLKKTDANLQTILNTNDTAYALLGRDLEVLEYNNKALIFAKNEFNFDPENDGKFFDHLPESRRLQFFEYINQVFKGNTISYEVTYTQPDGISIWYYVRMFPIADKEDEIHGLVLAITDITERKGAEESLQSAYERIQTQIKFIREMIWKQSHILRSPLANLKGLITILENDPTDKDVMGYMDIELNRLDTVIMEMAEDSAKDEMINYPS
jgi:PAS domain S-box-containing protein